MKIPISVLVVIYKSNGEVLLIERADKANFWQSVTGSIDVIDEDLSVAAAREVHEETGINVALLPLDALQSMHHQIDYEIYPQWRHRYAPGVIKNTEHWFSLLVPDDTPITLAPREHVAYQWVHFQEAASLCFSPSNGQAISQLFLASN
ncbi:dihydroneopterin triphosphate diphosphatase [Polynucleobacter brandtiae]|uniref:Dihydroneopterin triphosphate pyrophosphatase n=1 Tax=Polynucleobacter brandtiae TaxID=1938816 RepID=A0A2M8VQ95_9BURK|nr:dihydroneopterin triphosphate diphosphatase [Polynucleobacter brandtiae]PJI79345.1 dihydroneopterin triphosphate pyrophosphatase [Polynucleobacter brandtiae]